MCTWRCRLYSMTASTPSPDEGSGSPPLYSIRRPKRCARKRQLNEFIPRQRDPIGAPSHSDGSLRDRFGPQWFGKLRGNPMSRSEFLFDSNKGRVVLLRPSLQTILDGRSAISSAGYPADEYREKASPLPARGFAGLLLAFSPFIGMSAMLSEVLSMNGVSLSNPSKGEARYLSHNGAKKEKMSTFGYSWSKPARQGNNAARAGAGSVSLGPIKRRQ